MNDSPFPVPALPGTADASGWITEELRYRVLPRPKPKFKTTMDAERLFGAHATTLTLVTSVRRGAANGEPNMRLSASIEGGSLRMEDRLECVADGGARAAKYERRVQAVPLEAARLARDVKVEFGSTSFALPRATYPETMLPFAMRAQPYDGQTRTSYGWISDLFVARVYYESRGAQRTTVPAGSFQANEVWMYPDLNDWVALGSMLTKLAKPFLPRYTMWYEVAAPHRLVRFEGSFGPPGAPEIILELT